MPRDGKPNTPSGDADARRAPLPERRRSSPRKQKGFVERATASGHSGYGSDSVRPHLRDQLRLKNLLPHPYPIHEVGPGKDDHHQ